jgi:hypothetical protein
MQPLGIRAAPPTLPSPVGGRVGARGSPYQVSVSALAREPTALPDLDGATADNSEPADGAASVSYFRPLWP